MQTLPVVEMEEAVVVVVVALIVLASDAIFSSFSCLCFCSELLLPW